MRDKTHLNELKRKIYEGDKNALGILYKLLSKDLTLYAFNFSNKLDTQTVEDIVQEIFVWISTNTSKLNYIEDIESYLFIAIRRNVAREEEKLTKHRLHQIRFLSQKQAEGSSMEEEMISEQMDESRKNLAENLIESLPKGQKQVLFLRYYSNLSYKQISEIMELSEQVVRNYAHRAIKKLRG